MCKRKKKNRGLTLVEVIIFMALMAIFSAISARMLNTAIIAKTTGTEYARAQVALRQAALAIARDIRMNPTDYDVGDPHIRVTIVPNSNGINDLQINGDTVAQHIASRDIVLDPLNNRLTITLTADYAGGTETLTTSIFLRTEL